MIVQERLPALGWGLLRLAIYLATEVWPTSMPSLRSSPWILGAPQRGLARLIPRIRRRISSGTLGLPLLDRDFQRQNRRKPARCQRTTVRGSTIAKALRMRGATATAALAPKQASPLSGRRFLSPGWPIRDKNTSRYSSIRFPFGRPSKGSQRPQYVSPIIVPPRSPEQPQFRSVSRGGHFAIEGHEDATRLAALRRGAFCLFIVLLKLPLVLCPQPLSVDDQ
jgi:hypothetical protein